MQHSHLSRYEFLKSLGFRGAALMAVLTSCVKEEDKYINAATIDANGNIVTPSTSTGTGNVTPVTTPTSPATVAGTSKTMTTDELNAIKNPLAKIDLASSTARNLGSVGGYIIINNAMVLAQVSQGSYAAVTVTCTHEPKKRIIWNKTEWYCTDHGARFDITGKTLNNVAPRAITAYNVATDGKTVVIY